MDRNELAVILIDQLNKFLYPKLDKTNMTKFCLLGSLNTEVVASQFHDGKTSVSPSEILAVLEKHNIHSDGFLSVIKQLLHYGDIFVSCSYKVLSDRYDDAFVTVNFNLDLTRLDMLAFANELARYE